MTDRAPPKVTDVAPDFTLSDATGTPRRLADLCATQPLLLVFYRGHW
jgi:peroxiredoxin